MSSSEPSRRGGSDPGPARRPFLQRTGAGGPLPAVDQVSAVSGFASAVARGAARASGLAHCWLTSSICSINIVGSSKQARYGPSRKPFAIIIAASTSARRARLSLLGSFLQSNAAPTAHSVGASPSSMRRTLSRTLLCISDHPVARRSARGPARRCPHSERPWGRYYLTVPNKTAPRKALPAGSNRGSPADLVQVPTSRSS